MLSEPFDVERDRREPPGYNAIMELPIPPSEMRALVGSSEETFVDNPSGEPIFDDCDTSGTIFDFGCGCGRLARQLIQQREQPKTYVGIDLHRGMINWCQSNLAPIASQFQFKHHDVYMAGFNPNAKIRVAPLPGGDHEFDLVIADSVFTHITESAVLHYLTECARLLSPAGVLRSTWFLFEKAYFPMMQGFQNASYINEYDPANAVVYDREWLVRSVQSVGLVIVGAKRPLVRGFHWHLLMKPLSNGTGSVELGPDLAPFGSAAPPVPTSDPSKIGLKS